MNQEQVMATLATVKYPGFEKDIVAFGFVKAVKVSGGEADITLEITASGEEIAQELRSEIIQKLGAIGIKSVALDIKQPAPPKETSSKGRNLAPQIKNFVMVSSGKGGVGKSTTTVNLAIAAAMQGKKVGILDADIYGPNIPRMLGVETAKPEITPQNKLKPIAAHGVQMMSMGVLVDAGQSLIWRGPMIMKTIEQFFGDVLWGELDVLFIDMPPGTGDAQLSLAQSVPVTAGVMVSTPQSVALDDARRGLDMFNKLHIPIAGIVENMSGFICPESGKEYDIFGKGTCAALAQSYSTGVLAEIPIEPTIREGGDSGQPLTISHPSSESAKRYLQAADQLWNFLQEQESDNAAIQPIPSNKSACSS
jgi:ATP-binding protein involved in chromosome partitioning